MLPSIYIITNGIIICKNFLVALNRTIHPQPKEDWVLSCGLKIKRKR